MIDETARPKKASARVLRASFEQVRLHAKQRQRSRHLIIRCSLIEKESNITSNTKKTMALAQANHLPLAIIGYCIIS